MEAVQELDGAAVAPLRKNSDYVRLTVGEVLSAVGTSAAIFVLPLVALELARSAAIAGLVGAAATLGTVLMSLPAGALVDRWNARRVMLTVDVTRAALWASLAVAWWVGHLTITHLAAVAVLNGAAGVFFRPAETVVLRQLVHPTQMRTAFANIEGRQATADLLGAPLGGLALGLSAALPFIGNAMSFLASFLGVVSIRTPVRTPAAKRRHLVAEMRQGLAVLFADRALRDLILIATILNFAVLTFSFGLVLGLRIDGMPAAHIGLVNTAVAVGVLVGSFVASALAGRWGTGRLLCGLCLLSALVSGAMILAGSRLGALVILAPLILLAEPAVNASLGAFLVSATPAEFQGRVQGSVGMLSMSLLPVASAAAGAGLSAFGRLVTLAVPVALMAGCAVASRATGHVWRIAIPGKEHSEPR